MSKRPIKPNTSAPATTASSSVAAKPKVSKQEMINTTDISSYFFPLFYAGERGALGIWDKKVDLGHIKRRVEAEVRKFHVLEMVNPHTNSGTYITIPKTEWQSLHVTLPHFVIVMRNFRRNFSFDILVLDNKGYRRRFTFATWFNPSNLKKYPFLCQVPLKLDMGWNEVHIDLEELVRATYRTQFVETVRLQIHANCRLRQIFFCDDQIINGEMPVPSMKIFENMKLLTTEFGPLNHPDYLESGPDRKRETTLPDPAVNPPPSRIEKDINILQAERYKELTCSSSKPLQIHYRGYFRNLLLEKKNSKTVASSSSSSAKGSNNKLKPIVVVSEDFDAEDDDEEEKREGVPIPLDMKRSVNLMELITKGKQQKSSGSTSRTTSSVGLRQGQYYAPISPPPSAGKDREPYYFRPATPFPPPK